VLTYYAIANASAWTLPPEHRRWPRHLAGAGLVGCLTLACTLPVQTALTGTCVLATGAAIWAIRQVRASSTAS
jgi:APA family basic amino acid/polyamine antiporter